MAVWLVRAGKHGELEEYALTRGVVVVGWDEMPDLSVAQSYEAVQQLYQRKYPDAPEARKRTVAAQLWAFCSRVEVGDIVALPSKHRPTVALGTVAGGYVYSSANPPGARHTRRVEWKRTDIPRTQIGQDLLYSLGAFSTVCQIQRNAAEQRFAALLKGQADPYLAGAPEGVVSDEEAAVTAAEVEVDLEQNAMEQIRTYLGAHFRGHDLARLVDEVLKAQGYHTYRSAPGPDKGVDLLVSGGPMGFESPRMCVQVKSGASAEGVGTLRELQGVMTTFQAECGLLVSWGGFKDTVYNEARAQFFRIRLWDSDDIIRAIFKHYDQLSEEIQAELPLKRIWILVPQDAEE